MGFQHVRRIQARALNKPLGAVAGNGAGARCAAGSFLLQRAACRQCADQAHAIDIRLVVGGLYVFDVGAIF